MLNCGSYSVLNKNLLLTREVRGCNANVAFWFASFEQEAMSKRQKNAEIKKLTSEIVTLKR